MKLKRFSQINIVPILACGFLSLFPIEADCENQNYFTFGSTVSEVVAVQGKPDSIVDESADISGEKTVFGFSYGYGKSEVSFNTLGFVDGWYNHRNNPLKTAFYKENLLIPRKVFTTGNDYFTLGATEGEVIAVQGIPEYVSRRMYPISGRRDSFAYGDVDVISSYVEFTHRRVTGWRNVGGQLKVKLVPNKATADKDYFTRGSTIDEIAAAQGTPDYYSKFVLEFGASKVFLRDGRVTGWEVSASNPLNVKLLPRQKTINTGFFTVNSTKDEVLVVQGTPDSFDDYTFSYDSFDGELRSHVYFKNDRVVGWLEGGIPLTTKSCSGECFTIGSTKEEVLALQGTPSEQSDTEIWYGASYVKLKNNRVIGWNNFFDTRLKVELLPNQNTSNIDYFTISSTMDEVLSVHGTPDAYRMEIPDAHTFRYGHSSVNFQNGCVTEWEVDSSGSALRVHRENDHITRRESENSNPLKPMSSSENLFTYGSTQDEVLAVQGIPDAREVPEKLKTTLDLKTYDLIFRYTPSFVGFKNGRVAGWNSDFNRPLNVELRASENIGNQGHFAVGSTMDEVLVVQGTPHAYLGLMEYVPASGSIREFRYGRSTVTFVDGRVTKWTSNSKSPLRVKESADK